MVNVGWRRAAVGGAILLLAGIALGIVVATQSRPSTERLLTFGPSARGVAYESPVWLDDGVFQLVSFVADGEESGLGLRRYSNPKALSAEEWIRERWDSERRIVLEQIDTAAGRGVIVRDSSKWLEARESETAFPVFAVIAAGDQIVVVDQLNGLGVDPTFAEMIVREARR